MKDAYYFPHDSNAKDDPKCVLLIEQLGLEGYGIYWMLVETLRDQPEYKYPVSLLPALARRYNTTAEKVKTVVSNYGLFSIENDMIFYSDSLIRRMEPLNERRLKLSEAGKKGNEIRWGSGGDRVPIASKGEKSKEKESKEKEIIPYTEIINLFNSICTSFPKVHALSTNRKNKIRLRFDEMGKSIETVEVVFRKMQGSSFLRGENQKGWKATFDWLFSNGDNWLKVYENNYANKQTQMAL